MGSDLYLQEWRETTKNRFIYDVRAAVSGNYNFKQMFSKIMAAQKEFIEEISKVKGHKVEMSDVENIYL